MPDEWQMLDAPLSGAQEPADVDDKVVMPHPTEQSAEEETAMDMAPIRRAEDEAALDPANGSPPPVRRRVKKIEMEVVDINQPNAPDAEVQSLRQELYALRNEVDNIFLVLLLVATAVLLYKMLPTAAMPLLLGCLLGFGGTSCTMWQLGALDSRGAILLMLNAFVIVPFNVVCFVMYYVTYLFRASMYQCFQTVLIPCMSSGKVWKLPWDADFTAFLSIMPLAFDWILPPQDDNVRPFDNIEDTTVEKANRALRNGPLFIILNKWMKAHVSHSLLNSLSSRLILVMALTPTIGWWWVGYCSVPLLPIRHAKTCDDETGAKYVEPKMPAVELKIPCCRWLSVSRDSFGEKVGKAKCLNE